MNSNGPNTDGSASIGGAAAALDNKGGESSTSERNSQRELLEAVARYERQVRLFDGVASTTPDFVYLFDRQGRFLYANRRLLEVWGMKLDNVVGKTCRELGYEQWHHDMHMREIAQVIETKAPIKGEVPFKAPLTGIFGVYEYIFTPVIGPDGEVEIIAGTTRDVTERKRGEEALRASEENARRRLAEIEAMYEAAPIALCVFDTELRWLRINRRLAAMNGVSVAGHIGKTPREIIPEFADIAERVLKQILETGEPVLDVELSGSTPADPDVVRHWVEQWVPLKDEAGRVIAISVAAEEVTEKKRAEAALRASEERERARATELETIMEAVPVAVYISRDRECTEIIGNRMAYDIIGLAPGSNLSKTPPPTQAPPGFRVIKNGHELPPEQMPAQRAAQAGEVIRNFEHEFLFEDGSSRTVLHNAAPLLGEDGAPRGAVGAVVDITERKRDEERLRQTQKLESIGLLAGGIAHDFNNILTGILGNASMVLDEVSPTVAERLNEVVSGAQRAAHLTRQLLAYSGKGEFVVEDLDVSRSVNEIASFVEFSIPKSVQLSISVQTRLPVVRMDPSQLQQVLMNLVINAGEAVGEGNAGKINVSTSMSLVEKPFTDAAGELVQPGRYVCIDVADDGPGINEDIKSRIFDPFFTTKFAGRGLGLAAVAGILRSQKGGITVESIEGHGAAFRVFLPVAETRAGQGQDASRRGIEETILVVDDEASVLDFIGTALRRRGYRVLAASDGQEALAMCRKEPGVISAVVLDVVMPLMGANELLPAIKRLEPRIKVLLTSGYSEVEARRLCAAYPGSAFVQKPYTAQQIFAAVERTILSSQ